MKILSVRFKNLNSLTGEWFIDFTTPDYDGLFAITGPTGAGKSTILDAICLGLYGSTPRLNKVTGGANDIMSRLTGECFSEVRFETEKGRYRCRWEQHRARNKPDGTLQSPKHEICMDDTDEILQTKSKGVLNKIEEVTGMDFKRFTRSMLLAQGDFSAFLQASADDRSPILEQITGTDIYSKISKKVFDRTKEEEKQLENMKLVLGEIRLLSPEEESQKRENLKKNQSQRDTHKGVLEHLNNELSNLRQINEINEKLNKLGKDKQKLDADNEDFKAEDVRLERALKAFEIHPIYQKVCDGRNELVSLQKKIAVNESKLSEIKTRLEAIGQSTTKAEADLKVLTSQEASFLTLIDQVQRLDVQLQQELSQLTAKNVEFNGLKSKLKQVEDKLNENLSNFEKEERITKPLEDYKKQHLTDEALCESLAGIQAESEFVRSFAMAYQEVQKKVQQESVKLENQQKVQDQAKKSLDAARPRLKQKQTEVQTVRSQLEKLLNGRLLREYRVQEDSLREKLEMRRIISSLEEHRHQLRDGEPCPLCGALEHPYALGNFPQVSELESEIKAVKARITQIEEKEDKLKKLEADLVKIDGDIRSFESQLNQEKLKTRHFEDNLREAQKTFSDAKLALSEHRSAWIDKVREYVDSEFLKEASFESILENLEIRVTRWKDNVRLLNEANQRTQALKEERIRLTSFSDELKAQYQTLQAQIEVFQKSFDDRHHQRTTLFGDRNPQSERDAFYAKLNACRDQLEAFKTAKNRAQNDIGQLEGECNTLKSALTQEEAKLTSNENAFVKASQTAGFANEQTYCEALLTQAERLTLQQKKQELDKRQSQWQTEVSVLQGQLSTCEARKTREVSLVELEAQITEKQGAYDTLVKLIATDTLELDRNDKERARQGQALRDIEQFEKTVRQWQNLRELIGSADGKKFRNFAQGITFDVVIKHANEQLQRMSDRYLLIRSQKEVLGLEVIDNYLAGEIRSTKNLSGGESFIVSLALALGLSSIASEKVSVDSLFLDEGFGTLDEEALEMAIETLSQLRENGKLIGVISHVQALKDRIGTQIEVVVQNGGNSSLRGPGCQSIAGK